MSSRVKYLEGLLPKPEDEIDSMYAQRFNKYATYLGNGVYQWGGIIASDLRELYLMGVLSREGVQYRQE